MSTSCCFLLYIYLKTTTATSFYALCYAADQLFRSESAVTGCLVVQEVKRTHHVQEAIVLVAVGPGSIPALKTLLKLHLHFLFKLFFWAFSCLYLTGQWR